MVGIVIVSHSARLAEGAAELAREMAGDEVPIEPAGGMDDGGLGTDATRVIAALERAGAAGEVLVLMDLGSAVLSAETALDLMPEGWRERVLLCEAPLVEGAVAAAVAARLGGNLEDVAAEARRGLAGKEAHLGDGGPRPEAPAPEPEGDWDEATVVVGEPHGLHARPAARLVRAVGDLDAEVRVENLTAGRGPAPARSLSGLSALGALEGHELRLRARGPDAAAALAAAREIVEGPGAPPPSATPPPPEPPAAGETLRGVAASPGSAAGPARRPRRAELRISAEPAGDPAAERADLEEALGAAGRELGAARDALAARGAPEEAGIIDAQLLVLEDEALLAPARRDIASGRSAAWAWRQAVQAAVAGYEALDDPYLRARAVDVREAGGRALARLAGGDPEKAGPAGPGILVADELGAAETAELDPAVILGLATAGGGPTSHSAILARTLGIPAVAGLGERLLGVEEGVPLLLDGDAGRVVVAPGPAVLAEAAEDRRRAQALRAAALARAGEPAVTRDGHRVEVVANVGGPDEVAPALASGAEGVGLLRTEFLFLGRASAPDEEQQRAAYGEVAEALGGRRLILRTLDAGADKPLPYLGLPPEENPFLGVRGVRLALARPELLLTQLRAALRVAAERPLSVMFPMVATVQEVRAARRVLDEARAGLVRDGFPVPDRLEVGVMIEVPSAALMADLLAAEVDFLSIGTNDLTQYTMAAERGNGRLAHLLDPLEPAVLRLVARVADAARAADRWVGVCGEAAGDPVAVPVLVGLGVHELSASGPALPLVKETVRGLEMGSARALADAALDQEDAAAVRRLVLAGHA